MSDPSEPAPEKAARLGLLLVEPKDNELFVDLDHQADVDQFGVRLETFLRVYPEASVQYTRSSGGGWHAYVTVPNETFTIDQRIALQAALGSDPLREMIAISHAKGGYQWPCVFFETPDHVKTDQPHSQITADEGGAP